MRLTLYDFESITMYAFMDLCTDRTQKFDEESSGC